MSTKRSFKAALLMMGRLLQTLSMLAIAALLSRLLLKEDYAGYRQTFMVFNLALPLLTLGLPEGLYYFLPLKPERGRQLLSTNVTLLMGSGVIFGVLMWLGGAAMLAQHFNNAVVQELLLIFSPYPLLMLPLYSIDSVLVATNRVQELTVFNICNRLALLCGVVGGALVVGTPQAAVWGAVISSGVMLGPGLWLMYRAVEGTAWKPSMASMRTQLGYSVPLGMASALGIVSVNLDKLLVSLTDTPEAFAVYANGAMQVPLVGIITGSVTSVLLPEFTAWFAAGNFERLLVVWKSSMVKVSMIIFPTVVFLFVMAPEVMVVLFSEAYEDSAVPFRIYLMMLPVRVTTFSAILMAAGKSRVMLAGAAVSLTGNTILSIILIQAMGSLGAAVSTVAMVYLWGVPYPVWHARKLLGTPVSQMFPWGKLAQVMALALVSAVAFVPALWWDGPQAPLARLALYGALYGAIFAGMCALLGPLPLDELRRWVKNRFRET